MMRPLKKKLCSDLQPIIYLCKLILKQRSDSNLQPALAISHIINKKNPF
jgi:hypothetical protein